MSKVRHRSRHWWLELDLIQSENETVRSNNQQVRLTTESTAAAVLLGLCIEHAMDVPHF